MTTETTPSAPEAGALSRPRPRIHFTADDGWINDPYGVTWTDGEYHLYYQAIPGRVTWAPNCHWGHARSTNLVHFGSQSLALVPQDFEVGCWSGSVVDDTEPPKIFYTRVSGDDWEIGQVAVASPDRDSGTWHSTAGDVVVDSPPAELRLRSFRDPNVFRSGDGWTMLMAAALPDGSGAVLQYRSADLRDWTYDGILCSRPNNSTDDVPTGALWECPQLFALAHRWVLLVSVWEEQDLKYVAAAVGNYDGQTFRPDSWQRLTHGESAYAMTAFADRDGRRCVLSWLREEPRNNESLTERAGAHSVVSTIDIDEAGVLVLRPHPDVDAIRGPALPPSDAGYDVGSDAAELATTVQPGTWCEISGDHGLRARFSWDPADGLVTVDRPGFPASSLPVPAADPTVRLLLDADIVEIFTATTYGAYRIAPAGDPTTTRVALAGTVRPFRP